jgi:hypothetical protein
VDKIKSPLRKSRDPYSGKIPENHYMLRMWTQGRLLPAPAMSLHGFWLSQRSMHPPRARKDNNENRPEKS